MSAKRTRGVASFIASASLLAAGLVACGDEEEPPPRYPFTFTATSDQAPLAGVAISASSTVIGTTDEGGILRADLTGPDGQPISVNAHCPEGYRSPAQAQQVTLRRMVSLDPAAQGRGIEVSFDCPPEYRDAVVVVRTHGQPDLPVYVDGQEVTRTDASGAAHVHRRMTPQASFQVKIATASNTLLRPQDPSQTFTIPDRDEVFVFDQPFSVATPPRRRRRRRAAPRAGPALPVRIGRH